MACLSDKVTYRATEIKSIASNQSHMYHLNSLIIPIMLDICGFLKTYFGCRDILFGGKRHSSYR